MHRLTDPEKTVKLSGKNFSKKKRRLVFLILTIISVALMVSGIIIIPAFQESILKGHILPGQSPTPARPVAAPTALPTPTPAFDPTIGSILPTHRVVAFYAVPGAEPTGPAFEVGDDMLSKLKQQGAAYEQLDPAHPVQLGIDLVVSVPDSFPGPNQTYSHHVDEDTIKTYIDFCQNNNLLLFLDLNIGWSPVMDEVKFFMTYLEKYPFIHMAIDPEWMFPRHNGIPGTNLSNVQATDLNPIISAIAAIPMQYHVPRKILIIHQYRQDGDGLNNPNDPGQAEIADKHNIEFDPRVDVVFHIDSVGGYSGDQSDKKQQYTDWVKNDMQKYENFEYGGFKIFYKIEAKIAIMAPKDVLALDPPPMIVTYGN